MIRLYRRNLGVELRRRTEPFLLGVLANELHAGLDDLLDVNWSHLHLQLACFHLGQVQYVVDDREKMMPACFNGCEMLKLDCRQLAVDPFIEVFTKCRHDVQRRPQLVRDIGEKHALGLVGCLCSFFGLL